MGTVEPVSKLFTPKQNELLKKEGFDSLYSIVTTFPYRYVRVKPADGPIEDKEIYLLEGEVLDVQKRPSHFVFRIHSFATGTVVQCYYFVRSSFVFKAYPAGSVVQAEIQFNKGFVNIKRLAIKRQSLTGSLGGLEYGEYITPLYSKKGKLTTTEWHKIHKKIPDSAYLLDYTGLVPENNFVPMQVNLKYLHKPEDVNKALVTQKMYNRVRMFLKLALNEYSNQKIAQKMARPSKPDRAFLTQLNKNLPFDLSLSQRQAIWEIMSGFQQ